ncbi:MAG: hypothetical protein DCC75_00965 [Proteobacteria bacterium]|nr:MAG: hypothetical protein DCC75_00965 [Pseudomonadota bacterium]
MKLFGMVSTKDSLEYTKHALDTFARSTPLSAEDRFILIDNDGSYQSSGITAPFKLELAVNSSPLSFAANANNAVNMALELRADLFFLNNDVIFFESWIDPMLIEDDSILSPLCNREVLYGISIVVCKSGHVANTFVNKPIMQLSDYLENRGAFAAIIEAHRKVAHGYAPVFMLPFFCVKIPLRILETIGRFDESFGKAGGEDYDYCMRTYLAGFDVRYALSSYLVHFCGKSSWSGAETEAEQIAREEKFRGVFRDKWGDQLFRLVLKEDYNVLSEISAENTATPEEIRHAIGSLMGGREIALRL